MSFTQWTDEQFTKPLYVLTAAAEAKELSCSKHASLKQSSAAAFFFLLTDCSSKPLHTPHSLWRGSKQSPDIQHYIATTGAVWLMCCRPEMQKWMCTVLTNQIKLMKQNMKYHCFVLAAMK